MFAETGLEERVPSNRPADGTTRAERSIRNPGIATAAIHEDLFLFTVTPRSPSPNRENYGFALWLNRANLAGRGSGCG